MSIERTVSFVAAQGFPRKFGESPTTYLQRAVDHAQEQGIGLTVVSEAVTQLLSGEMGTVEIKKFAKSLGGVAISAPIVNVNETIVEPEVIVSSPDQEELSVAEPGIEIESTVIEDVSDEWEELSATRLSDDVVADYLRSIAQIPLLKAEEEVSLAKDIEAGLVARAVLDGTHTMEVEEGSDALLEELAKQGEHARQRFIESNLRLVVSVARRYSYVKGMDLIDLIQEGNFGLAHAVDMFDYQKGYKFSTYATWWIRQAITRSIADKASIIRLPVHKHEKVRKVARVTTDLHTQLGRAPTAEEVAGHVDMSPALVQECMDLARPMIYYHMPIGDDGDTLLMDVLVDQKGTESIEDKISRSDLQKFVNDYIDIYLDERTADIMRMRMHGATLEQVGLKVGVTRERVRQIERKARLTLISMIKSNPGMEELVRELIA